MARANGYLLDTSILVALVRHNDFGKYLERTFRLSGRTQPVHIASVVVGESRALSLKWHWGPMRRIRLETVLASCGRIEIGSESVLNAYAALDAAASGVGISMGKNDLWIAAVAQVNGLTLLTTDADFDHLHRAGTIDVEWVDPASA